MPESVPVFRSSVSTASGAPRRVDPDMPPFLKSRWTLAAVCVFALMLRMAVAVIFPGYEQADEIYQAWEQAHRIVFGYGIVSWEFAEGVRSYMLPGAMAGIFRAAEFVSPGSYLLATRFALSLLSLVPVCCSWGMLRQFAGPRAALIGAFLSAVWFELVYFGPKANSEVVAAHLLLLGTYAVFPYFEVHRPVRLIAGGFLLGLAFCLRIQLAPVIAVLGVVMLARNGARWTLYVAGGAVLAVAFAGLVDYFTLAYPYASIIGYFKVNALEGVSDKFGRSPWYFLIFRFVRVWSGALILFVWAGIEGLRNSRPMMLLFAMAAVLVLVHSGVAHKEYRFIYPALPLLLIPIAAGIDRLVARLYPAGTAALVATLAGIAALSLVVGSGDNFRPHFWRRYGETQAFDIVRKAPDACGLALHLIEWSETPGYTRLHRDLPIYYAYRDDEFARVRDGANYLLSRSPVEAGYTKLEEWKQDIDPLYLYRREGGCSTRFLGERLQVRTRVQETTPH